MAKIKSRRHRIDGINTNSYKTVKGYIEHEPENVREALGRMKIRIVPAILASVALSMLVFLLVYFKIDAISGVGTSAVIFSSFASSIFIMFIMPNSKMAKIGKFVKSYLIAGVIGFLGSLGLAVFPIYIISAFVLFGVIVLSVITRSDHPPAAAIAFAFVLFHISYGGILVIVLGVIIVVFLRYVLEKSIFELEREVKSLEKRGITK